MKKFLLYAIVFYAINLTQLFAQPTAGIYLFCNTITTGAGTGTHPDEVEILSQDEGATATVTFQPGGGQQVGRPEFVDFVITKAIDRSSLRFRNRILLGQSLPNNLEIRYYNGVAPSPVYVIILQTCFVTSVLNNNVKCTNNCPDVTETYSFSPTIITWRNQAVTPNQVITYDRAANRVTSSGL